MGILDKMKAKAAERREAAELAAREKAAAEQSAARQRAEDDAAAKADRALDPAARIQQPGWAAALSASGIEPATVQAVVDGNGGTICSPGSSGIGMPNRRSVGIGVVALTTDDKLAYVLGTENGIEVVIRRRSELAQMRKANMDGSVWVVFENDRSFPDRGGQIGRADNWEIRAPNHDPDAIRAVFLKAGYSV
jgi:hypothetical protein